LLVANERSARNFLRLLQLGKTFSVNLQAREFTGL